MSAAPPKNKTKKTFGWTQSRVKHSVPPLQHAQTHTHTHTHTRPPAIFISRREQPVESAPDWVQEWSRSSEQEGQQGFKRW